MRINFVGTIFGSTGYAAHARGLFNAIVKGYPDVEIKLDSALEPGWELLVNDQELAAIKQEWFDDGVTLCIGTPLSWILAKNLPCKKFVGFCVWEGDKVPASWIESLTAADLILVPSRHVFDAIGMTCDHFADILDKVVTIPHGVDTSIFSQESQPVGEKFVFLANKGWSQGWQDRGGIQWVMKAFAEEFRKEEPVELRIKLNTVYNGLGWNLDQERQKLMLPETHAPISIGMEDIIPIYQPGGASVLPMVYRGADCFVTGAMAEAFNIPCAEAMSMGLPVITTAYGGQLDYVNEENGWLVPGQLTEVPHDLNYEGIKWMVPDLASLRKTLRYAFEHQEEVKSKGEKARATIEEYTWHASATKLLSALSELN